MRAVLTLLVFAMACSASDDLPPPVLASVSPTQASVGATVTISGSYLCQQPDDGSGEVDPLMCVHTGSVTFGVVPAGITSYGDTSITAQVPDIDTGPVEISVAVGGRTTNSLDFTTTATD
jgi:hypothetical protein